MDGSDGIYLIMKMNHNEFNEGLSLNPCCNGIYLIIGINEVVSADEVVLILVVMEYT